MSLNERLFYRGIPGNTKHVYDRERPSGSDGWCYSLCGHSFAKEANAKSFVANRDKVTCGTCLRILEGLDP